MRTSEAVTPVGGLVLPFALFSVIYLALGLFAIRMLRRELAESPNFDGEGG